ncbi:DUF6468 domain-containing protein [Sphingomonas sp. KRR8]|uniref:DUF6468 domain-containing protein n=1 Tax=Sphingomonas sp. KRR8 TaxID=2942996 RepID=UPI0020221050|nr:DUF6468 domain-containing protein [Sphingomonas sp. KRR8]URD61381.1 DUF6468 domain-containing protein [Sphingomonas sp. KRR8]
MSIATTVNLVLVILCLAVLVQCHRMMRSLDGFRRADLPGTAAALETATTEACRVLEQLRRLLSEETPSKLRALGEAERIGDELAVMIGIANASADRLLETAKTARKPTRSREAKAAA